ncbi:FctA domain-containing protein [Petroclostridium sp. X23]|uniref:Spy0128 family protein n=1 Tax=Petroclostridium sp. X23 TaxID=3045146 RepID=UPI0024ACB62A|nr:FctA domain-containing protein [Petroclostridium sp. X23]WHH57949.1 FctA domain-containing protein [Petroclostridium sp. X23]
MNKYLRNFIVGFVLFIAYAAVFAPSAFALGESMDLTVTTVIDNADEYPTGCNNLSSKYSAVRIYKMEYSSTYANRPTATSRKVFNIVNNQTTTIHYSNYSNATCDSFWFETNEYTDRHLSLCAVEYAEADNLKAYTYSPTGSASNPYSTEPLNWVQIIDSSKRAASVTLHFKYNPDIDSVSSDPDPELGYSKKIDYLGDEVPNPDTTVNGKNDYRLYLDVTTQQAAEDNKADIIFVLDVSGSMSYDLGSDQSRISVLKSTMINAINNLTQNSYNRISIIKFANNSQIVISNSTNRNQLISSVQGLTANGSTNYYQSLRDAMSEVNTMSGSDTENREKVIIFITDGEPTFAAPAAVSSTTNTYAGLIYACDAARQISNVDRFYSVFIGNNSGSASTLQTITQIVNVGKEKYMVQASSAEQVSNTLDRFMSKMGNSLYDVTISDELSQYVSYTGGLKVTRATGGGEPVTLAAGIDYSVSTGTNDLAVRLLKATTPDSRYTVSFNVRSSDEALDYYDLNQSYPDVGDADTDYTGNTTSSGQPGFYSNTSAALSYSFGGSGSAEKAYDKPVVQVVEPDAVPFQIQVRKKLTGKDLEEGMFSFELIRVTEHGDVAIGTVTNDADGFITFDSLGLSKPGTYTYKIKEVIPTTPQPGMTYDTKSIQVTVVVTRSNDDLAAEVKYPSEAVFANTYTPQPVSVALEANKELTGRTLTTGMFDFRLLESSGVSVETVSNTASGNIKFSPLTFTKAGVYTYTIRESVPIPANPNIVYDLKTITAQITVTDENGVLAAIVRYTPDATFRNQYVYSPLNATIELKKVLTGMQLTAGAFPFELKDEGTGYTETKTNQADGTVSFNLTYTAPGTHTYTIREVIPESPIKYMTYDTKIIQVTVQVEDNGTGELVTTVTYPADPAFYNSYKVRGGIW